ncbi:hypothetical protein P8452_09458 [Trifolium repens]|nr:hypothetical protein P8452_09458 [Trifolium repens]
MSRPGHVTHSRAIATVHHGEPSNLHDVKIIPKPVNTQHSHKVPNLLLKHQYPSITSSLPSTLSKPKPQSSISLAKFPNSKHGRNSHSKPTRANCAGTTRERYVFNHVNPPTAASSKTLLCRAKPTNHLSNDEQSRPK